MPLVRGLSYVCPCCDRGQAWRPGSDSGLARAGVDRGGGVLNDVSTPLAIAKEVPM